MKEIKVKCSICGKEVSAISIIKTIEERTCTNFSKDEFEVKFKQLNNEESIKFMMNNALPINNGRCCNTCNDTIVIQKRLSNLLNK